MKEMRVVGKFKMRLPNASVRATIDSPISVSKNSGTSFRVSAMVYGIYIVYGRE